MSRNEVLASATFALVALAVLIFWMEPWKPTKVTCFPEYYLPEEATTSLEKKQELLNRFFIDKAPVEEHQSLDWRDVTAAILTFRVLDNGEGFELTYFIEDSEGALHRVVITDKWYIPRDALYLVETSTCEFGVESRLDYIKFATDSLGLSFIAGVFGAAIVIYSRIN